MSKRLTILLTNDDGYHAPGIRYLYDILSREHTVIVAAPDREQSGVGHAFTFDKPLHYEKTDPSLPMQGYIITGTPADCIKFSVSYLLDTRPDVVVSGMNIGENSGISSFYSGTVAAAREGAFWNIPSFAFSICKESAESVQEYASLVPGIIDRILESHQQVPASGNRVYYNVNFPTCAPQAVRGMKITTQSLAFFDDRYEKVQVERHHTGVGYLIYGEKKNIERSEEFDSRAIMCNYISITPLTFDATANNAIPHLRRLEEESGKR